MNSEIQSTAPPASQDSVATCAVRVENLSHTYPAGSKRTKATRSHRKKNPSLTTPSTLPQQALDSVSFEIEHGEIFGLLGPNGCGKTTLFRILSTLLRPTRGVAHIMGHNLRTHPQRVRQQLGVVFQMPSLDIKLTAQENLLYQGYLYGMRGEDLQQRACQLLEHCGLGDKGDWYVEAFSGGMRRRVELAKALLHRPPLLLLDEPSTGLDIGAQRNLWEHLESLRAQHGVTIMLTTHLMDEADRCDRLAILSQGKIVALDTPSNLKARIGGDVVTLEPAAGQASLLRQEITDRFGPWPADAEPVEIGGRVRFEKSDGAAFLATLTQAFPDRINTATVGRPTLEDVFMHLTGQALWE